MKKTLIATATYNEYKNIDKLIYLIFKASAKVDVLVIDDNSPDKTWLNKIKKIYRRGVIAIAMAICLLVVACGTETSVYLLGAGMALSSSRGKDRFWAVCR